VTENNGLKLPREFGLLVKQSLYFDRYLKILAPDVDVMNDDRVQFGGKTKPDAAALVGAVAE
jgi:aarF domain-containing kinase